MRILDTVVKWAVILFIVCYFSQAMAQEGTTPVCVEEGDAYKVALGYAQGDADVWTRLVEEEKCAEITTSLTFLRALYEFQTPQGPLQLVEWYVTAYPKAHLFGVADGLPPWVYPVTWVPSGNEDPAVMAWFLAQDIMPAAAARLKKDYGIWWTTCCDHADRVKAQFVVTTDGWMAIPDDGSKPFLIPPDIIHPYDPDMPSQLATEGVLMVVQDGMFGNNTGHGIPTCFWVPQGGI